MDGEIILSCLSVQSISGDRPEDFVTKFNKAITLGSNFEYRLGLNRIINMSFTWFNVSPSYNKQTIAYSRLLNLNAADVSYSLILKRIE